MSPAPDPRPGRPAPAWLRVVAALDTPSELSPPSAPLDDAVWSGLLAQATSRRLVGPLAWAVHEGRWPATPDQQTSLRQAHRALVGRDLLLERELLEVTDLLAAAGVPTIVLKGPALARRAYRHASSRSYRDIDLLVPADGIDEAVARLQAAGARRHFPEPRPGFDRRFTKGVALTTTSGFEVDLHRTLTGGIFGLLVDRDEIWRRAETIEVGGRALGAPDRTVLALHACLHAVLGDAWPPIEVLRDVAVVLHHQATDLEDLRRLARAWQAEAVVAYAVGAAWTELGLDPAHPAASWAAHRLTARDRRRLRPYLKEHRSHARQALAATAALPPADHLAYLRAVAWPDAAVRTHRQRWQRGLDAWRPRVGGSAPSRAR